MPKRWSNRLAAYSALAMLVALPTTLCAQDIPVQVIVDSLRSDEGRVVVSVYTSEESFLQSELAEFRVASEVPPGTRQVSLRFMVPAGPFAMGVLHDEDGDGEMDTNFIGMPKEGMGATNNPKSRFGPPGWEDALVESAEPDQQFIIQANYLF